MSILEITQPTKGSFRLGYANGSLYGIFGLSDCFLLGHVKPSHNRKLSRSRVNTVAEHVQKLAVELYGLKPPDRAATYSGLIEQIQIFAVAEGWLI